MATATLSASPVRAEAGTDKAAILAVVEAVGRANREKDAELFAAQFAQDAAVFNLAPPLEHRGIDLKEKRAWMDSWATPIELETRDLEITVSGDFAFCHGFLRMSGRKKGAEHGVDFWMRETLCLERKTEGWQIVHEHTSVPFYMDASTRPAFDLKP